MDADGSRVEQADRADRAVPQADVQKAVDGFYGAGTTDGNTVSKPEKGDRGGQST